MNAIETIIDKIKTGDKDSLNTALQEALGTNNVSTGSKVAVIGDPTYPFDGQLGTVKSINNGFAKVEFANGVQADLHVNLLIPV